MAPTCMSDPGMTDHRIHCTAVLESLHLVLDNSEQWQKVRKLDLFDNSRRLDT